MEEAVGVECLRIGCVALEVAFCDGWAFEQNLVVLADLDLDALNGPTYGSDGERLAQMVAGHGSQTLGEAVADIEGNTDGVDKLLHLGET